MHIYIKIVIITDRGTFSLLNLEGVAFGEPYRSPFAVTVEVDVVVGCCILVFFLFFFLLNNLAVCIIDISTCSRY